MKITAVVVIAILVFGGVAVVGKICLNELLIGDFLATVEALDRTDDGSEKFYEENKDMYDNIVKAAGGTIATGKPLLQRAVEMRKKFFARHHRQL